MARKTRTSSEVKRRYNNKTYKRVVIQFRYDSDQDMINFVDTHKEKYGITNIFRDALKMYMDAGVLDD